jgi:hypothetical protein
MTEPLKDQLDRLRREEREDRDALVAREIEQTNQLAAALDLKEQNRRFIAGEIDYEAKSAIAISVGPRFMGLTADEATRLAAGLDISFEVAGASVDWVHRWGHVRVYLDDSGHVREVEAS